jgi:tRNA modification GTPase
VVVAGPPNVGKSSLINTLSGEDRSIVTDVPGTTRDHIEVPLSVGGVPVRLIDTAGLRNTEDQVESIGVARAGKLIEAADVLVWLGEEAAAPGHRQMVMVHAKVDLPERRRPPPGSLGVSSVTGEGVASLLEIIESRARTILPSDDAIALNRRQALHIEEAADSLSVAASGSDPVLVAEDLRRARGAFDRLTGRAGVEDVLDALFGRFCLGK